MAIAGQGNPLLPADGGVGSTVVIGRTGIAIGGTVGLRMGADGPKAMLSPSAGSAEIALATIAWISARVVSVSLRRGTS